MDYKVAKILREVFGFSPIYNIGTEKSSIPKISFSGIEQLPDYTGKGDQDNFWDDESKKSYLGSPILFQAKLSPSIPKRYNALAELVDVKLADFEIPPATMYQFRRAKNITKTNILGSNGTVKEIFGFDDWIIDVKGICLDTPTFSAKHQLKSLLEYSELASNMKISGALFNLLEIDSVVIEDFSFNILQGSNGGAISFQMQLTSDEAIEIQSYNKK